MLEHEVVCQHQNCGCQHGGVLFFLARTDKLLIVCPVNYQNKQLVPTCFFIYMKCFTPACSRPGRNQCLIFKTIHAAVDLQLFPSVTSPLLALPCEIAV